MIEFFVVAVVEAAGDAEDVETEPADFEEADDD